MDDKEILANIDDLIQTEHELRTKLASGEISGAEEHARLAAAEQALDQCWDLLRQRRADAAVVSEATVKLTAKGERIVATGEGNGPVNALDNALRIALERLYPELARLELADYKVRILENSHGTGAVTRVLIESGDGTGAPDGTWSTVGVDENIIAASWHALEEAVTYALLRAGYQPGETAAGRG